ncbi:PQQ-binding-like beta-propeller repeat protein [Nocardiopsis sp. B62]|uniref:outer membrane protein assembly factor BamB family protein n=1 Tax=Nocardiopsis sp. B62 TaxID=2824874 RepID=UPI001B390D50|nr:PQQ-binding-like beta-propeller repeat protein [Nocardiopsis sp. B62]MBQ1081628.1 hypothetical protein [Nocardiopsis sp. B62]
MPPLITVVVSVALCWLALALLGPFERPRGRHRVPVPAILAWDLGMLVLGALCAMALLPTVPHIVVLFAFLIAVLLRTHLWEQWIRHRDSNRSVVAGFVAATFALTLLVPALAYLLPDDRVPDLLACAQLRATSGESDRWTDADSDRADLPVSDLASTANWSTDDPGRVIGGHDHTVTLIDQEGVVVRSADQGLVLWHIDARLPNYSETMGIANHVHQVGDTVMIEYFRGGRTNAPSQLIAYTSDTGRLAWCRQGPRQVLTDPVRSDRFVARVGLPESDWGLFDAGDGSLIAALTLDGARWDSAADQHTENDAFGDAEIRAHLSEDRVTVWSPTDLASYDAVSGELLTEISGLGSRPGEVVHAGEITVVSSSPDREDAHTIAYDADGTELWSSDPPEGHDPRVESGFRPERALVGGFLAPCPSHLSHRALDEQVLVVEKQGDTTMTAGVRARDGVVTWERKLDATFGCTRGLSLAEGGLVSGNGLVVGPDSTQSWFYPDAHHSEVVVTANGIGVSQGDGRTVFHPLT